MLRMGEFHWSWLHVLALLRSITLPQVASHGSSDDDNQMSNAYTLTGATATDFVDHGDDTCKDTYIQETVLDTAAACDDNGSHHSRNESHERATGR